MIFTSAQVSVFIYSHKLCVKETLVTQRGRVTFDIAGTKFTILRTLLVSKELGTVEERQVIQTLCQWVCEGEE